MRAEVDEKVISNSAIDRFMDKLDTAKGKCSGFRQKWSKNADRIGVFVLTLAGELC